MTQPDDVLQVTQSEVDEILEIVHQRANKPRDDDPCSEYFESGLIEGAEHVIRELEQRADTTTTTTDSST